MWTKLGTPRFFPSMSGCPPVTQGMEAFRLRELKRFFFQSVQCPEPDSLQHLPDALCTGSRHFEGCTGRLSSIHWLPAAYCHNFPHSALAANEKTQSQEGKGLNTQLPRGGMRETEATCSVWWEAGRGLKVSWTSPAPGQRLALQGGGSHERLALPPLS